MAEDDGTFVLWSAITAAATVPENLAAIRDSFLDPLGLEVGDLSDQQGASAQEVSSGTFGAMAPRFDGRIGAIVREVGTPWALFVAAWTTGIAYSVSVLFYQLATFSRHPLISGAWILALALLMVGVMAGLRAWARREGAAPAVVAEAGA